MTTPSYRIKLYGQSEGLVVCVLITLYHNLVPVLRLSTDYTQRLSNDPVSYGTLSRGQIFLSAPAEVATPLDEPESEPTARIAISNVDRLLVNLVRSTTDGVTALLEVIDPAEPDSVQRAFPNLQVVAGTYDAMEVSLEMRVDMLQNERYPYARFTSTEFPLVF